MEREIVEGNKVKGYFNYSICKACGGACCKSYAGIYIPSDFKESISAKFILSLLQSGKFSVDWWEGDATGGDMDQTYYIRPRHVNESAVKGSWGGVCVNFNQNSGCSLSEHDRPFQCRMLIPGKNADLEGDCDVLPEDKADKKDCAIAWYPYQSIISDAIDQYYTQTPK